MKKRIYPIVAGILAICVVMITAYILNNILANLLLVFVLFFIVSILYKGGWFKD